MGDKQTRFVPFGEWSPDTIEFEAPELEIASNFVPVYGAYRPIEKLVTISSQTDGEPLNGGISHIVSSEAPPVRQQPESEGTVTGNWYSERYDVGAADNDYFDDRLATFDPTNETYIRSDGANAAELRYNLSAPVSDPVPVLLGDVTLKFNIRVNRDSRYDPYTLDYELWDTGTATQIGTTQTLTLNDPDGEEWYTEEWDIPTGSPGFADITNWDQLEVRLLNWDATLILADADWGLLLADENIGQWIGVDSAGTEYTVDIYQYGNVALAGYRESYLLSPSVPPNGTEVSIFKFADDAVSEPKTPVVGQDWISFNMSAAGDRANCSIKYQIIQPVSVGESDDDEDYIVYGESEYRLIGEHQIDNLGLHGDTSPPTAYTETAVTFTVPENFDKINFSSPFYLALVVSYGGGGSGGETVYTLPDNEEYASSFVNKPAGGVSDVANCVGGDRTLADDTNYYRFDTLSGERRVDVRLGDDSPEATDNQNHTIYVRMRSDIDISQDSGAIRLMLVDGDDSSTIKNQKFGLTANTWTWLELNLSGNQANQISNYANVILRVQSTGNDTANVDFAEAYFSYPGDSGSVRSYATWIDKERADWPQFSWIALDSLNPKETNTRDRVEIYAGNESAIYNVTDDVWIDVTRTVAGPDLETDYADLTKVDAEHKIWDFCTFGDKVIGTNFSDAIQAKDPTDSVFSDLIDITTSPYAPRARFCAVISSSLVLADISPTSYTADGSGNGAPYTSGKPFQLWASKPMDPSYFDLNDLVNQTAIFSLVGQPGAITGLVGGEWGTVFKRNSIWRMTYVGLPYIMQLDHIAIGQGCSHPQSIVQVGQDIYFWGNGGIFALYGGSQLVRLSGNKIEKAIFDTRFEDIALAQDYGFDSVANESRVYGAYDAYSGVVWWLYRGKEDQEHKMNRFVCYSQAEDRFTHGHIASSDLSLMLGRMNVTTADNYINRGVLAFKNTGTASEYQKFSDLTATYEGTLKTKILSPTTWGYRIGRECEIQQVRALYKADPDTYRPNFTITVEASQDPTMQRDNESRTVTSLVEDRDGWIPLGEPLSGEYFRFTVSSPELNGAQLKEILGLQLMIRAAGDW
jgi:hypothetical protein